MAKDIFDISDDAWGTPQKTALKEFTDREDPQEAFERKFRVLNENWKKTFYVLSYYGIGGIGKTSFINKLCRVIRNVEGNNPRLLNNIDCNYIRYDFDEKTSGTDKLSILISLRKQLGEVDKNFMFFRFDSALLLYAKKSGHRIENDETVQSLLEHNPWLDTIISAVGIMPVVGWVSGVIQTMDKSAKLIKEAFCKHMDEKHYRYHLNEIDSLEIPELFENLHNYFIQDMRHNMQYVATKPIIVFLDTYEKYIDTLNRELNMITEDYWLRKGNRSVIRSIPGLLWVITGREKLYWSMDDEWDELTSEHPLSQMSEEEKEELAKTHLEQHLLGDLSLTDATSFLDKAGIKDSTLCQQLYTLTNGTPLFLDICVDTYNDLCCRETPLNIEQFGKDITQLISRYLSNMNEANREMAYFLASLGSWNDESVQKITNGMTTLRWYTYAKYKAFLNHSFITKNLDGSYCMHDTVRNATIQNADSEILEESKKVKFLVVKESVETDTSLKSYNTFKEYIDMLTENNYSYEEFCENVVFAIKRFRSMANAGSYDLLYTLTQKLFLATISNYSATEVEYIARSEYGYALCLKGFVKEAKEIVLPIPLDNLDNCDVASIVSIVLRDNGMYHTCLELDNKVYTTRIRTLGEAHPDTLIAMNNLALSYGNIGKIQDALELRKKVYALRLKFLGETHPDTLVAMNNLAVSYGDIAEFQKALELSEKVYALSLEILGETHPDTITAMNNLAFSYRVIGKIQKALELRKMVYELRLEIFGQTHPDTITAMNNLAISYEDFGEIQKTLELRKKVYNLCEEILGETHPNTITAIHNLAASYKVIGEIPKALELHQKVYVLRLKIFGQTHPGTITAMNSLAASYTDIGEIQKALELRKKVYALRLEILGETHPNTVAAMLNLASSYSDIGEIQKALELRKNVYDTYKEILGETHPDTITAMNNLALSYGDIGESQKALELRDTVHKLRLEILGETHPDTITAMNNLALSYEDIGESQKALELRKNVYTLRLKIFGEAHPATLIAMNNLAISYGDMNEFQKALELSEKVYALRLEILGETHPDTIISMNNLALYYDNIGEFQKALELRKKIYNLRLKLLGENHPDTLATLNELALSYEDIGEIQKALELREKVNNICKEILGESHHDTH